MLAIFASQLVASPAAACTSSAGGAFSYELDVGPHSGHTCSRMVRVHRGPTCSVGTFAWEIETACHHTTNLTVVDDGSLVSILAEVSEPDRAVLWVVPAFHPSWGVELILAHLTLAAGAIRVGFEEGELVLDDGSGDVARVRLADLPRPVYRARGG